MPDKLLRLLLVEDNPGDARLVEEMLSEVEGATFKIQWVETLRAALESLSRSAYDAALVDLSLPDCLGSQVFTTIQVHAPNLPIVVLTGLDNESMAREAMRAGVRDYLLKGKLSADSLMRALGHAVVRQSLPVGHAAAAMKAI